MRAFILIAAGVAAGMASVPETAAQDGSMSWIDAARNAPSVSAPAVPVPDRRPRPPASPKPGVTANAAPAAAEATPETAAPEKESARTMETSPTFAHEAIAARALGREIAAQEARPESAPQTTAEKEGAGEITGSTPRTKAAETASATPPPARKPARPRQAAAPVPPQTAARQKKRPGQASAQDEKCEALGRCRDAFARCKARFIKENGEWDLEKEPCGAKYKVCIRKTFAPGEMFFTRWFWPYEACP